MRKVFPVSRCKFRLQHYAMWRLYALQDLVNIIVGKQNGTFLTHFFQIVTSTKNNQALSLYKDIHQRIPIPPPLISLLFLLTSSSTTLLFPRTRCKENMQIERVFLRQLGHAWQSFHCHNASLRLFGVQLRPCATCSSAANVPLSFEA